MTPQEKVKDKRLWKIYRWTLGMYNRLGELQKWRCYGCGKHISEKSLNLDHEHPKFKSKQRLAKGNGKWEAEAFLQSGLAAIAWGPTKKEALEKVKDQILPHSVRGLLCAGRYGLGCNTKLGRSDNPAWLRKMAVYLENPPAKQILKDNNGKSL